jgi:hypothetical protein
VRRVPGTRDFEAVTDEQSIDPALPGLLIARVVGRVYFGNTQVVGDKIRFRLRVTAENWERLGRLFGAN